MRLSHSRASILVTDRLSSEFATRSPVTILEFDSEDVFDQGPIPECQNLGLIALYLHGSQSSGNARPDSDTDFAFLLPREQNPSPVEDVLIPLLSRVFGCDESHVDLQNLRQAPPHFRVRVLEQGRLLHLGDPTELARFHVFSVSEDRDLERYLRPFRQAMRQRIREGKYAS